MSRSPFAWVCALALATGCATAPPPKTPADLWAGYARAVEAARIPVQAHVSTGLAPILRTNPELRWEQGRVLMATWTKKKYYDGKVGQPYTLPAGVTVWLTPVPYLQDDCRGWGLPPAGLPLRIAQALGLPPPSAGGNDSFVQMWVDPSTFFRPCPDPEITDHECQVNVDGSEMRNPRGGSLRSQCGTQPPRHGRSSSRIETLRSGPAPPDPPVEALNPRVATQNRRVGTRDPRVGWPNPRVAQENPRVGKEDPRVGKENRRVERKNPRVRRENPGFTSLNPRSEWRRPRFRSRSK